MKDKFVVFLFLIVIWLNIFQLLVIGDISENKCVSKPFSVTNQAEDNKKEVNLQELTNNQPDFKADVTQHFTVSIKDKEVLGDESLEAKFELSSHFAKKGNFFKEQILKNNFPKGYVPPGCTPGFSREIIIIQNKKGVILFPRKKTYQEYSFFEEESSSVGVGLVSVFDYLKNRKLKGEILGLEEVSGYSCKKIKISNNDKEEGLLYVVPDLNNLFIKMSFTSKNEDGETEIFEYFLKNISFDVPDKLFEIPKTYRKAKN